MANPDTSYKLHYFNGQGRAEPIRMMLTHAKAEWRDMRIVFDQWPKLKPTAPNGKMPFLTLRDGSKLGESYAIGRYLGSVHGYYPADPRLAYEVDYLLEGFEPL